MKNKVNRYCGRRGFTMVEILVSMAILGMIVLLMGRIFADSSSAYKQGLKSSDQNMNGRIIMDYIARELKQAIVDDNLVMRIQKSDADPYEIGLNDWISFAAIGGKTREVELIRYYVQKSTRKIAGVDGVDTYTLNRGINTTNTIVNAAYTSRNWAGKKGSAQQMARNLSGFAINLFDENGNPLDASSGLTELPAYADIYMGLLGDSDLVEATIKRNNDNFVAKREMVFIKRVYFRNRGYNSAYGRDLSD